MSRPKKNPKGAGRKPSKEEKKVFNFNLPLKAIKKLDQVRNIFSRSEFVEKILLDKSLDEFEFELEDFRELWRLFGAIFRGGFKNSSNLLLVEKFQLKLFCSRTFLTSSECPKGEKWYLEIIKGYVARKFENGNLKKEESLILICH